MKATQVPQTQPFAPRQLKSVHQGETNFLILSDESPKAKGFRTDGVGPCIVLCGRIAGNKRIALGMNHWAGTGSSQMTMPITPEQETHLTFTQFCAALRYKANQAGIRADVPMEIMCIGGERRTEETRGTEQEQRILAACLANQTYIGQYNIDASRSETLFNVKDLEDGRVSVYLLESEVYYKKYRGDESESASYHSGSSGSNSPELRREFNTFKEAISEQIKKQTESFHEEMKKQTESFHEQMEKQSQQFHEQIEKQSKRIDELIVLLEQRQNEESPEKRQRRDPSFLGGNPSP